MEGAQGGGYWHTPSVKPRCANTALVPRGTRAPEIKLTNHWASPARDRSSRACVCCSFFTLSVVIIIIYSRVYENAHTCSWSYLHEHVHRPYAQTSHRPRLRQAQADGRVLAIRHHTSSSEHSHCTACLQVTLEPAQLHLLRRVHALRLLPQHLSDADATTRARARKDKRRHASRGCREQDP